ncbi:hypothetical protein BDW22DRAFT_1354605 [Trametopsis cervina]|nr:hypothetical protein BDW22DRAFT_1354605 [Trametopsis cervina]
MEDIRFVLEAPQNTRTQKKRPRLVTSCDNCRMKKIKCIQPTPNVICEACSVARLPCRFHDRERYFAERSRMVSAASKPVPEKHKGGAGLASDAPPAPTASTPALAHSGAGRSTSRRSSTFHPYHASSGPTSRASSRTLDSTPPPPSVSPLFDPRHPDRPHSQMMMPFLNAFFDHYSIWFPFLAFDETLKRFLIQDLPVLQANCMAALAVPYVDIPEVGERGVTRATDEFASIAKSMATSAIAQGPDLDTLHSLILLSWVEYNHHRVAEFCHYGQSAIRMAEALGLGDEGTMQIPYETGYELNRLKSTWACVSVLQTTVQSCL